MRSSVLPWLIVLCVIALLLKTVPGASATRHFDLDDYDDYDSIRPHRNNWGKDTDGDASRPAADDNQQEIDDEAQSAWSNAEEVSEPTSGGAHDIESTSTVREWVDTVFARAEWAPFAMLFPVVSGLALVGLGLRYTRSLMLSNGQRESSKRSKSKRKDAVTEKGEASPLPGSARRIDKEEEEGSGSDGSERGREGAAYGSTARPLSEPARGSRWHSANPESGREDVLAGGTHRSERGGEDGAGPGDGLEKVVEQAEDGQEGMTVSPPLVAEDECAEMSGGPQRCTRPDDSVAWTDHGECSTALLLSGEAIATEGDGELCSSGHSPGAERAVVERANGKVAASAVQGHRKVVRRRGVQSSYTLEGLVSRQIAMDEQRLSFQFDRNVIEREKLRLAKKELKRKRKKERRKEALRFGQTCFSYFVQTLWVSISFMGVFWCGAVLRTAASREYLYQFVRTLLPAVPMPSLWDPLSWYYFAYDVYSVGGEALSWLVVAVVGLVATMVIGYAVGSHQLVLLFAVTYTVGAVSRGTIDLWLQSIGWFVVCSCAIALMELVSYAIVSTYVRYDRPYVLAGVHGTLLLSFCAVAIYCAVYVLVPELDVGH